MFGFLGPNGAGKTTAVKLLLGLTRPTGGGGTGARPAAGRPRRAAPHRLPARAVPLPGLARRPARSSSSTPASPACPATAAARRSTGSSRSSASRAATGDRTGGFSKGMQQRLGLAAALLGDPALVILDEPTSALDPVGRDDVRAIIRDARRAARRVLLNSHLLGEVERLCDRVAIVNRGRVVAAGSLADLLGEPAVRLRVTDLPGAATATLAAFGPVERRRRGLARRPACRTRPRIPDLVAAVVAAGGRVHAVDPGRRSLEDLFLDLVRDDANPSRREPHEPAPGARRSPA